MRRWSKLCPGPPWGVYGASRLSWTYRRFAAGKREETGKWKYWVGIVIEGKKKGQKRGEELEGKGWRSLGGTPVVKNNYKLRPESLPRTSTQTQYSIDGIRQSCKVSYSQSQVTALSTQHYNYVSL